MVVVVAVVVVVIILVVIYLSIHPSIYLQAVFEMYKIKNAAILRDFFIF